MSRQFKVQVEFEPLNDDRLIDALNGLAQAQNTLRLANQKLQISAERVNQAQLKTKLALEKVTAAAQKNAIAVEKLKLQKKILQKRLDKTTLALKKYQSGLSRTTRTGVIATRSNRLLSNSFATIRSQLLLVSFGAGLISSSFIRLAKLSGEQKRVEDQLAVALGRTSQALLDQASALQQTTGFGDESIIAAQAQLAAFTDNEEAIKRLTVSTLDFATAQGMTLNEAAKLLGKSIGSSTNALSRYGVTITGAVGSTERLDSAVAGIAELFGNQATARLLSFNGQLELASGNIGDVGEDLGAELVPQLTIALTNFNKFALMLQKNSRAFEALQAGLKLGVVILASYFIRLNAIRTLLLAIPKALINAFKGTGKFRKALTVTSTATKHFGKRLRGLSGVLKSKNGILGAFKEGAKAVRLFDKRTVATGAQSLIATTFVASLASAMTGLKKSVEGVIDPSKINNVVSNQTVKTLKELNMETPKYLDLLAKETSAIDKLNQKRFILASNTKTEESQRKALVKTIGEVNKQSGLQIELGEIKNIQDLQNAILTQDKLSLNEQEIEKAMQLAQTLFDLNMITQTGSISNAKANQLRLESMSDLAGSFAQLNAGSKSAALVAIRLDQIKAVANAYGAFGQYMDQDPPRPGLASLALAKGLANAAIIEKQASKARAAATGADFVTQGFTRMTVGEEGAERVQVTPLGGNNRASVGGSSDITVNINGNVVGTNEFVRDVLIPSIADTLDRNLA